MIGQRLLGVQDQVDQHLNKLIVANLDPAIIRQELNVQADAGGTQAVVGNLKRTLNQIVDPNGLSAWPSLARHRQEGLDDPRAAVGCFVQLCQRGLVWCAL